MSTSAIVRIAICDDSRTYAHALKRFLERDLDLRVVGVYPTAEELLAALPTVQPDMVTMDLELPGLDGVTATERIMQGSRPVPVIVLSAHVTPGGERAAEALAGGAVEAILKSELRLTDAESAAAQAVRRRIKRLAQAKVRPPRTPPPAPRTPPKAPAPTRARRSSRTAGPIAAVGVAASTGGPQALAMLLGGLPATFPIPVLVVQHMAIGFTTGLASWLDRQVALPVRVAVPGTRASAGVWFAPDGAHLTVDARLMMGQDTRTKAGRHKPAADVLFKSMAKHLGATAAAVVLTGMGRDGAGGVAALVAAGGFVIAQDEASSVVNGMPSSAVAAGAHSVLALEAIGPALRGLPSKARR